MSGERANDQDGGHSFAMNDLGVLNRPSMQVSNCDAGSNFVTKNDVRSQFKTFQSMLIQFQDNLTASWSNHSTQVG